MHHQLRMIPRTAKHIISTIDVKQTQLDLIEEEGC